MYINVEERQETEVVKQEIYVHLIDNCLVFCLMNSSNLEFKPHRYIFIGIPISGNGYPHTYSLEDHSCLDKLDIQFKPLLIVESKEIENFDPYIKGYRNLLLTEKETLTHDFRSNLKDEYLKRNSVAIEAFKYSRDKVTETLILKTEGYFFIEKCLINVCVKNNYLYIEYPKELEKLNSKDNLDFLRTLLKYSSINIVEDLENPNLTLQFIHKCKILKMNEEGLYKVKELIWFTYEIVEELVIINSEISSLFSYSKEINPVVKSYIDNYIYNNGIICLSSIEEYGFKLINPEEIDENYHIYSRID